LGLPYACRKKLLADFLLGETEKQTVETEVVQKTVHVRVEAMGSGIIVFHGDFDEKLLIKNVEIELRTAGRIKYKDCDIRIFFNQTDIELKKETVLDSLTVPGDSNIVLMIMLKKIYVSDINWSNTDGQLDFLRYVINNDINWNYYANNANINANINFDWNQ